MDDLTPKWLDKIFLSRCIENENEKGILVTDFTVSSAVPPGNNYSSCILRVNVIYKTMQRNNELNSLSLILKSELSEGTIKELNEGVELKEHVFYKIFLPEANKLTNISFAPKFIFSPDSATLILEDLSASGFVMADKMKQLDFQHCCLYAKAAASLHAVSFTVFQKKPELVKAIGEEKMFSNEIMAAVLFKCMIKNGFECLVDSTQKIDRFKKYCKIMEDISVLLWDMLVDAHKPSCTLNTINQGDSWTTNMMFKYDNNGDVCEIKLLDFQMLRYGSPVNDLMFFIWSSANHDVRLNRLADLYKVYLDAFNSHLLDLSCTEVLTYESFMDDVKKLSPLALHNVATCLPFLSETGPIDFGAFFLEGENPYKKYYNEEYCNNHLPKLLEQLESAGVFDYLEKHLK